MRARFVRILFRSGEFVTPKITLEMAAVFLGEIFERFTNHGLVIALIQLAIGLSSVEFPLFLVLLTICDKGPAIDAHAPFRVSVAEFVLPMTVRAHLYYPPRPVHAPEALGSV